VAGIAQVVAEAGFDVTMRDVEDRFLDKGLADHQEETSNGRCPRRRSIAVELEAIMTRISVTTDLESAAGEASSSLRQSRKS